MTTHYLALLEYQLATWVHGQSVILFCHMPACSGQSHMALLINRFAEKLIAESRGSSTYAENLYSG